MGLCRNVTTWYLTLYLGYESLDAKQSAKVIQWVYCHFEIQIYSHKWYLLIVQHSEFWQP